MNQRTFSATFLILIFAVLGANALNYMQSRQTVEEIQKLSTGIMLMSMELNGMLEIEYEAVVKGKSKTIRVRVVRDGDETDSQMADRLDARLAVMEQRYPPA